MESATQDTKAKAALGKLEERFSGDLIRPEDEHYGAARKLWNGSFDRHPAVIARPSSAEEVGLAILAARDAELEIAVRCGGHSLPGHSMSEGGMTIDLSQLNGVEVDPETRRARVGGGALLMDVCEAGAPHGLAMPYGHISHTGVSGLTLGGGIGWIMRRYGLAIDTVRSAEVVTAEGEVVTASEDENPDLFWALRGGGGNFGVVTEFEYELCPHGPEVLAGMVLHPLEDAADALRFSREFMDQAPDELTVFEVLLTVPPEEPFPAELQGKPALALAMVYAGPIEEGEQVVRPLREFGRPALDIVGPMPNVGVQTMLDDSAPHGMQNYGRAHWLAELPDAAIEAQVELHADVPSPMSLILNGRMGGAVERVPEDATAFGHRGANRLCWIISAWWEGEEAEHVDWCRGIFDAMTPYSTGGVYVNAVDRGEGADRVRASYNDKTWTRLVAAKDRWDPDNVFRLNPNIAPSGA